MFGSTNNVTSTWGQPAQQPQQNTSAFGQPSAFGSGGAFGQTQQQQPQANPMFGNVNPTPSTSGTTGGFGAFANNNANQGATSGGLFGAPKPATGFGAFGGGTTSTFGNAGGGSAFGSTANAGNNTTGGGLFGQPAATNTTGAFGSGGGLFGQNKPATAFGASTTPTTGFGTDAAAAPVTTGTSGTPFAAFSEKDGTSNNMLQYQSITAMPAYRGSSYEELRVQDYQQGRKTAGGFGQTAFGATPAQPSTSTSGGLFGQPAQQPATSSIFGGGGAFGQPSQPAAAAPSTGFGAFGQPAAQSNTATTGGGIFGSFGQQTQQQQQPATGAFGQPAAPATGGGLFGNSGAFGQANNQAKPAGFGAFGSSESIVHVSSIVAHISTAAPSTTGATFGGGNAFGASNTQQTQQPSTGLFGQPAQNTGAFGALGNTNAPKPSIFGQPAQPATNTGGGLFGNTQQSQPATSGFGGGGLFGNNNQQQQNQQQPNQQPTGGLFGSTTNQPAANGGLFGGGGLFGNNNQQQQNQQQPATSGFGLFGAPKPATTTPAAGGGLFGNSTFGQSTNNNNTNTGSGLFGSTLGQSNNQATAAGGFGGGLFGNKPAATGLGQTQSQSGGLGSSIFGNSANANNASQGSLTASIAQPIGANLPIFSMLPPGPRAVNLDAQPKKKVGFFVDVPTRSPVPRLQLGYTPATTKLRGFASESGLSSSLAFSTGKPNALAMSRNDRGGSIGPDGFGRSQSPALGSGGRQSVKKLILDKKVEPSDLFARSGSPGLRGSPSKITFNPAMSQAAREKDVARETAVAALPSPSLGRSTGSPAPQQRSAHPPNHFSAHSTNHIIDPKEVNGRAQTEEPGEEELLEGDYWVKPDLKILRNAPYTELSSYEGIVVGRVGYGEIHFLEPVDLTGLSKLEQLKGHVVRFDDKECTVYPDSDDADKPSPGTGLNVRAKIVLVKCWAVDKATREPIKDEKHPAAIKHLKRLKNMRDTNFESFDLEEGKWTFSVDHF
ncbi:hypothetical protein HWV62_32335 [Athelia sp. TMB]|nr:hypothetical protein HWV62_32335 [Athelia sp. TMB]